MTACAGAYANLAIHNAIAMARARQRDADGAAAGAAATVFARMYPEDEAAATARLQREVRAIGGARRARFEGGVEVGRAAAQEVLAQLASDRAGEPWTGTVPTGAGKWASMARRPAPPLSAGPRRGAHFGAARLRHRPGGSCAAASVATPRVCFN